MKITNVELSNWGPYFGTQNLNIETSGEATVIVVGGSNGNGKTKFIDALKWVFAGGDFGLLKVGPYISLQAISAGKPFETSVSVHFRQDDNTFILKRFLSIDPESLHVRGEGSIRDQVMAMPDKSRVQLQKVGSEPYSQDQALRVMERLFPARLVGFYFFDAAKLLDNFESISSPNKSAYGKSLKLSVEMAMGLRGLDLYLVELQKIQETLLEQLQKDARGQEATSKASADLHSAETDRARIEVDVKDLRDRLRTLREEQATLGAQLAGAQSLLDAQTQRNRFTFELENVAHSERIARQRIPGLVKTLWMAPMTSKLTSLQEEVAASSNARGGRAAEILSLQQQIAFHEKQKESDTCLACGQGIHNSKQQGETNPTSDLASQLATLQSSALAEEDLLQDTIHQLLDTVLLSPLNKHRFAEFFDLRINLERLAQRRIEIDEEVAKLNLAFGDGDNSSLVTINERFVAVEKEIFQGMSLLRELLEQSEKALSLVTRTKTKLMRLGGPTSSSAVRLEGVQSVLRALEKVSARLRNDVRAALRDEANLIFAQIRSKADERFGIDVDENYFVTTTKHNPNAAFMQQVFLSFLFAIPRVAKAPFPVVIDSPIQHMDTSNRNRFLNWCKTGLPQLVLLPHDGEIAADSAPKIFGNALAGYYEIEHNSATGTSSFRALKEEGDRK